MEHQEAEDAARLAALREAAGRGWADIEAGRHVDVADVNLDDFMAQLGASAARSSSAD